jgi:hypothetical protein
MPVRCVGVAATESITWFLRVCHCRDDVWRERASELFVLITLVPRLSCKLRCDTLCIAVT